ncbi:MAG: DUF1592 domain-containing protein [Bryobacteraceae bacterium]|nr:DUF1592 domain-containing protein [Bryobacteraceae bacterium]
MVPFCLIVLLAVSLRAQDVQPVLNRYCVTCHNASQRAGNLDLRAPGDQRELWEKVLDKLSTGRMPPPGVEKPQPAEAQSVIAWIEKRYPAGAPDPGRVTARRLNRVEYNNTIRDLLGVDLKPADDFPVDDSGYGFDNIGDVLSVSPMLMEKYMAAARRVAQVAVFGESYPARPGALTRLLAKRSAEGGGILSNANYLPYSMRGALYGAYRFPVDGEYEFRVRVANFRGQDEDDLTPEDRERYRKLRASVRGRPLTAAEIQAFNEEVRKHVPPRKVVFSIDDAPVLTAVVEGTTTFDYDRGEFVTRVPVKAGERRLRASYPELAGLDDPRQNVNRDQRRKLFVDYLDIIGPFQPSKEPPASYRRIFVCGHAPGLHRAACARTVVERLARRAWRRPVTEADFSGLISLVNTVMTDGQPLEQAVRAALQAILASPHFLFRIESDAGEGTVAPVSEHELASRLSYFLWASMPDDELLDAALNKPGVLEAEVRRMLKDRRSGALIDNFAAQWLQLRNLDRSRPDPKRYPTVDDELVDAMRRETFLFMEAMLREDRSLLDLLDAPFTFVNGPLAKHYGIPGITGEEFRRVELNGAERGGLLSQGAILTVSSYSTRTSPVMRGKWVLENLLGTPPPAAPPDVPQLDESRIGSAASLRQQMEQHRQNPACAVCHTQMDAIGFSLESYDASGAWRTHDGKFPIDTSGVMPDGTAFSGVGDLKRILRGQSAAFTRNIVEKTMTYALGRGLELTDRPAVERIARKVAEDNHRFSTLVLEIARSAPFRMRRGEGGGRQ